MGIIKKYLLFSFAIVTFFSCSLAQEQTVIIKNGKKYYKHIVQSGNTLWGIHDFYNTPIEGIVKANPGIENGIKVGQIIYVPVVKQNTSDDAETKKHIVQQHETLYGISKQYNISIEALLKLNPTAKNGLKEGQVLIIPNIQQNARQNENVHIVEKGETLYGIATSHNLTVEQLLKSNPEAEKGLQIGQVLNLPNGVKVNPTVQNENNGNETTSIEGEIKIKDSTVRHRVRDNETLYSISKRFMVPIKKLAKINNIKNNNIHPGQILVIPLKKVDLSAVQIRKVPSLLLDSSSNAVVFNKKSHYNIAVLLPLNYDKNDAAFSGVVEKAHLNPYTKASVAFYMGIKMALDSLQQYGLNATVSLIDTQLDSNIILKALNNSKPDLIIGPLMPKMMIAASRWSENNKTPMLSLAAAPSVLLQNNAYFFSSVPSDVRLLEGMADALAMHHNQDNIVLVTSGKASDKANYEHFKTRFNNALNKTGKQVHLKEVNYRGDLKSYVKNDKNNIFICPTNDRVVVSYFMTAMNKIRNTENDEVKINVYGLKEWEEYNELKLNYKLKLNLHYPSSIGLNYQDSSVVEFIHQFRDIYQTDPDKFAIQGFDVAFYFVSHFLMELMPPSKMVMNNFHYAKRGLSGGVENNNVFIMRYDGFEIKKANIIYE